MALLHLSGCGIGSTPQVNNERHKPPEHHADPAGDFAPGQCPCDRPARTADRSGGPRQGHDCVRPVTERAIPEGNRVSRISVRGLAVASATAVTTVGAVVGVASGAEQGGTTQPVEAAGTTTLLADIPAGQQVQQASLTEQAQAQSDAADASARQSAEEAARVQAAKDAAVKKQKADDAAAAAKKKKEEAASTG